jgi:hypothetical protein
MIVSTRDFVGNEDEPINSGFFDQAQDVVTNTARKLSMNAFSALSQPTLLPIVFELPQYLP